MLAADGGGGVAVGNFCFTDEDDDAVDELGPFNSSISEALCGNVELGIDVTVVVVDGSGGGGGGADGAATGDCFGFFFRGLLVGGVVGSGFFFASAIVGAGAGVGGATGADGIGGVGVVSGNCCASGSVLIIIGLGRDDGAGGVSPVV